MYSIFYQLPLAPPPPELPPPPEKELPPLDELLPEPKECVPDDEKVLLYDVLSFLTQDLL